MELFIRIEMENKVKCLGAEIIKSKTHYGIATCVLYLGIDFNQRQTIVPTTSVLKGEYGIYEVAYSVYSIIGVNGIERRLEELWSDFEIVRFEDSAIKLSNCIKNFRI